MESDRMLKPARSHVFGGATLKALVIAALATLCVGFGVDCADAQEADKNMSLVRAKNDVAVQGTSLRGAKGDAAIHNSEKAGLLHFVRNDISGTPTGFASDIDPEHIGDTLVGTNHVTYSSSDPGDATGHVDITNPDGSTQSIYYTYTMPSNYEVKDQPGDVIDNSVPPENASYKLFQGISTATNGGVIKSNYFNGTNLTSDFIGNSVQNNTTSRAGGVMSHTGVVGDVRGDFISNFISTKLRSYAGVFDTNNKYGNITGDFIGNYSTSTSQEADSGVIWSNNGNFGDITGNFIGNYAKSYNSYAQGGVIFGWSGNFKNIKGIFIGNYAEGKLDTGGGVISTRATVGDIEGIFISNYAKSELSSLWGGVISNSGSKFNSIKGDFLYNYILSESTNSSNMARGGAFYNEGTITNGIINSSFIENYAKIKNGIARGGAIWTNKDLNIIADNGTSTFKDNYVQVGDGEKDYQAIWVDGADKKLNLQQFNNGKMYMYDNINGTDGYTVNIQGDGTGTYYMLNDIKNANVGFDNTTVNTVNNDIHTYDFNSLALNSNTNFVADVDLVNEQMDHIETGNNYTIADGAKLTVSGMNLLNDAEKDSTKIFFAEENLANSVDTTVKEVAYSPIYKYDVNYVVDENDNQGYFTFARSASGGSGDFNPAVVAAPVATQAAAQVTMENTFNYSFSNSETFMQMPNSQRIAIRNRNKYAIAENELPDGANPLYQVQDTSSAWFKPYASFENVPLKNGPKVNVISYGALAGYDTDLKELRRGWARAWTGFVGYNGASINYSDVSTIQNGGILGGTLTMYKGNFFNATTLSVGATVGENNTRYGHETTTSILSGLGNKTGYNFEFKEGKFIIQPNLFLGYTMVKTFDYTNAAGVRIDSNPSHTFQISPGLKLIGNLKHGWQPYIGVNMVWNVLNNSTVRANSVTLPQMSVKPYIQYGIGLQKTVKDNFVAYGQAMIQNGGRNGISLTAGFRWAIGKIHKPTEKVQKQSNEQKVANKKVIKQLVK